MGMFDKLKEIGGKVVGGKLEELIKDGVDAAKNKANDIKDDKPHALSEDKDDGITQTQELLLAAGFDPNGIDGGVGDGTKGAYRDFLTEKGFNPEDFIDGNTLLTNRAVEKALEKDAGMKFDHFRDEKAKAKEIGGKFKKEETSALEVEGGQDVAGHSSQTVAQAAPSAEKTTQIG